MSRLELTGESMEVYSGPLLMGEPSQPPREVLKVTAAGAVTARAEEDIMVPITLAAHRTQALRKARGLAHVIEILAAELAEREMARAK